MGPYIVQVLTGVAAGAVLFLVASGLTLVFGALRIINFAHGSLYMLGAFLMLSIGGKVGTGNVSFWSSLVLSALAVALLGAVLEILILRRIYARVELTQLVVTFGLVLVISGVTRQLYGARVYSTDGPPMLSGSVSIFGSNLAVYQLFLIGLAPAVALALWALLYRTGLGRNIRAAVSDRELLELSGVNVPTLFTVVFCIGAFFAGLAGAVVASQGAVQVGMDIDVIIKAFLIVVIGGLGSLTGAFVASMLVGISEALGTLWLSGASLIAVFVILIVVLAFRPQGLFGQADA